MASLCVYYPCKLYKIKFFRQSRRNTFNFISRFYCSHLFFSLCSIFICIFILLSLYILYPVSDLFLYFCGFSQVLVNHLFSIPSFPIPSILFVLFCFMFMFHMHVLQLFLLLSYIILPLPSLNDISIVRWRGILLKQNTVDSPKEDAVNVISILFYIERTN